MVSRTGSSLRVSVRSSTDGNPRQLQSRLGSGAYRVRIATIPRDFTRALTDEIPPLRVDAQADVISSVVLAAGHTWKLLEDAAGSYRLCK